MINHPNRSRRRGSLRIVLSNSAGPLDERTVPVHRDDTDEMVGQVTAQVAAALILETTFLYPGDTIMVTEIER
jgi:hypothetical protein